jgi:hypothetical protein
LHIIDGRPEESLIGFLNTMGKYFTVSDPNGVRRLSRDFALPEEETRHILSALGFVLLMRLPVKAYWVRKEILPDRPSKREP